MSDIFSTDVLQYISDVSKALEGLNERSIGFDQEAYIKGVFFAMTDGTEIPIALVPGDSGYLDAYIPVEITEEES